MEEIVALIVASRAMLEGMSEEGSPRPKFLVDAYNKLVSTHNLLADLNNE
jgi:hypothetical protein